MLIIPCIDACQAGYHVHLMVMGKDTNVANAGTTGRQASVTLTIPVTDGCYAFATDVCYAHPKGSSCLAWAIVTSDMVNPSFPVAHVMLFCGATCASPDVQNVPHAMLFLRCAMCASRCTKWATRRRTVGSAPRLTNRDISINLNRRSIPKGMKIPAADIESFPGQTH